MPASGTLRQKLAIKYVLENLGKGISLGEALRKAGYSESVVKNPENLTNSKAYKEAMKPFEERLQAEIDAALEEMKIKRAKAKYSDLTGSITGLTKTKELISGRPTSIKKIDLSSTPLDELEKLVAEEEEGDDRNSEEGASDTNA